MQAMKILSFVVVLLCSTGVFAEVAVIVNPANSNNLSDKDISRVFLGKVKSYADGQSIKAVNIKSGHNSRVQFEANVLHKSASQVKAYWSKQIFTGKGKPLDELAADAEVLKFVAEHPNAIGYVDATLVDSSVRVVKTF